MGVTGGTGPSMVWTGLRGTEFVVPIDPASRRVGPHIRVGADPCSIAIGEGGVWVASYGAGTVTRIRPADQTTAVVDIASKPTGLVAGAGNVWVRGQGPGPHFIRIDPLHLDVSIVDLDAIPVAASDDSVWLLQSRFFDTSAIVRLDPGACRSVEVFQGEDIWNLTPTARLLWFTRAVGGGWVLDALDVTTNSLMTDGVSLGEDVAAPRAIAATEQQVIVGAMLHIPGLPRGGREGPFALHAFDVNSLTMVARAECEEIDDMTIVGEELWVSQPDGGGVLILDRRSLEVSGFLPVDASPGPIAANR